ncbi:hypothetical protein V6R21_06650 [Limibacter armeniacum]|uniref:hypothetical protein n=1 Tax=Limibacter armeniacum TaxID=466084 RepID=UPI002FE6B4D1
MNLKNIIRLLLLLTLLACARNKLPTAATALTGEWTWIASSGGFAGVHYTPSSTGDQIKITFTEDTFRRYKNGILEIETSYHLVEGETIMSTDSVTLIEYGNGLQQSFKLEGDRLFTFDECYDCFNSEYIKE